MNELSPQALAACTDTPRLMALAAARRDAAFGRVITHSRKVFLPLTQLCRDVCHYCTFAKAPRQLKQPYLGVDEALRIARQGAAMGCREALFTLGEKPEDRHPAAREALDAMGFASTLDYLAHVARLVREETGLLPHFNPGTLTAEELARLRPLAPSMGLMLESTSERLCAKGGPHHGSPDKAPALRLQTLEDAGRLAIPFTSGLLIGIGETRAERIETLLALRDAHGRHGHLQEVIVQNFRAKLGTRMAKAPEPSLDELLWTIAAARLLLPTDVSVQVPPNLSPGALPQLLAAGIDDWGGISPLTPDHVNPEAPWPHLQQLAEATAQAGHFLEERLTVYPRFARELPRWVDDGLHAAVLQHVDAEGYARGDAWAPGDTAPPPPATLRLLREPPATVAPGLQAILDRAADGADLAEAEIVRLFAARGPEFAAVCAAADRLRAKAAGDTVAFVVNRNINYTNVCYYHCQFCAFSKGLKGRQAEELRGAPYDLSTEEIQRRTREAWARGATEVCLQGGIHPDYTGHTYLRIVQAVREAVPAMHVHAFSPLEVWQGAATAGLALEDFLRQLKDAGLGTLPGTAAEVLDDEVRAGLCPDKINTAQWLQVMETAHRVGLRSTATIMFGHIERPVHWARHLLRLRELQKRTRGFTEFVPLPFVHMEAPLYLKGRARKGPTFREALLMHAVARLALFPHFRHVQASWVKLGPEGVRAALAAGASDLGGTLMNESISRAAGTQHGQELPPAAMRELITGAGRPVRQRDTLYREVPAEVQSRGQHAPALSATVNTPVRAAPRPARALRIPLVRHATPAPCPSLLETS